MMLSSIVRACDSCVLHQHSAEICTAALASARLEQVFSVTQLLHEHMSSGRLILLPERGSRHVRAGATFLFFRKDLAKFKVSHRAPLFYQISREVNSLYSKATLGRFVTDNRELQHGQSLVCASGGADSSGHQCFGTLPHFAAGSTLWHDLL